MGQGTHSNILILFIYLVHSILRSGQDTVNGLNDVSVSKDNALRHSRAAGGVHDDRRVSWLGWRGVNTGGRSVRHDGRKFVEGDAVSVRRQRHGVVTRDDNDIFDG